MFAISEQRWVIRGGRVMKIYVVPITHLRNVSFAYIPVKGKYAVANGKKPHKDWNRYEGAWHLLGYAEKSSLQ